MTDVPYYRDATKKNEKTATKRQDQVSGSLALLFLCWEVSEGSRAAAVIWDEIL